MWTDTTGSYPLVRFRTALAQSREYFAQTGYTFQERDERFEKQRERWIDYLVLEFLDLKKGLEITGCQVNNEEVWRILSIAYEDDEIAVDLGKFLNLEEDESGCGNGDDDPV